MSDLPQKELTRAKKALLAAKTFLENHLYEDCVSRAYYAAMSAWAENLLILLLLFVQCFPDIVRQMNISCVQFFGQDTHLWSVLFHCPNFIA